MSKESDKEQKMDANKINAMPTKELFIDMLTRDISLIPAIIDLVDNCADGAKRMGRGENLEGLWTRVNISQDCFKIADNCGGITVEIARKYAFRFGRTSDAPVLKHSIGEFGVGLKRAIFKMGSKFKVESATENSRFIVEQDVKEWSKSPDWEFAFSTLEEDKIIRDEKIGTTITVSNLHEDVALSFGLENFRIQLESDLKTKLQDPIAKGLAITVNGIPVNSAPLRLLSHDLLKPAYKELAYGDTPENMVRVKLYCGLGEKRDPNMAGWHIFCNGRLILEAEQTEITGWGEKLDGIYIPGFHGQFNYLRGYAYFDSDDQGRLPWNTTKTGFNTDSPIYRAVKLEMNRLMRPVVDFLNKLKEEKEEKEKEAEDSEPGPLEILINESSAAEISDVPTRDIFTPPSVPAKFPKAASDARIQYFMSADKVAQVKKALKVTSNKQVGEKTFDYFYNAEIEE